MGLKGAMKKLVFGYLAPESLKVNAIEPLPPMNRLVSIFDILTDLYVTCGPHYDGTFTGEEAFALIGNDIREWFNGRGSVYSLVSDSQKGVPKQKHTEQGKRRESNVSYNVKLTEKYPSYVRYHDECAITRDGIMRPFDGGDGPTGTYGPAERMILQEVVKNSKVRLTLMKFFCKCLGEMDIPEGKQIRFVFESDGTWYFEQGKMPELKTDFAGVGHGEYDTTAMRIAAEFPDRPILFVTTDTDTIPLLVSLLSQCNLTERVVWKFDAATWVDCHQMVRLCLERTGLTAHQFIVLCAACGTDFVNGVELARGFNDGAILAAISHPACAKALEAMETCAPDDYTPLKTLVQWLHTARLNADVKQERSKRASASRANNKLLKASAADVGDAKKKTVCVTAAKGVKRKGGVDVELDDENEDNKKKARPTVVASVDVNDVLMQNAAAAAVTTVDGDKVKVPYKSKPVQTSDELAAIAREKARCEWNEYELIKKHMESVEEPLSWSDCATGLGKKFTLPSDEALGGDGGLNACMQFNVWYWVQSWRLPATLTFEQWQKNNQDGNANTYFALNRPASSCVSPSCSSDC